MTQWMHTPVQGEKTQQCSSVMAYWLLGSKDQVDVKNREELFRLFFSPQINLESKRFSVGATLRKKSFIRQYHHKSMRDFKEMYSLLSQHREMNGMEWNGMIYVYGKATCNLFLSLRMITDMKNYIWKLGSKFLNRVMIPLPLL